MKRRVFWLAVSVSLLPPGVASAGEPLFGKGPGYHRAHVHYPHGPRVAPEWSYYGLSGGPFVTYPPPGSPGYPAFGYPHSFKGPDGSAGAADRHGPFLHHIPVPVYGPIPEMFPSEHPSRYWRSTLAPGLAGYGWFGTYAASPRPRPRTVSVIPSGGEASGVVAGTAEPASGCLTLSVRVPQAGAEVFVDGKKTTQTGTDRTFESPPVEAGKSYAYTVTARWTERGQVMEMTKEVSGTSGEVVRVDFGAPTVAGK